MATIDYSQLSKLWKIAAGTALVMMSAAGVVTLLVQKNAAGIAVRQEYSDGHSVQSGSLTVKSGSLAVNLRPNGDATFQGTMSGNHLYAGAMSGAGLASCSNGATSKLLWNSATNRFSCGTDQTGAGGTFGSGNVVAIGDSKYLKLGGGTLTGALLVKANISGSSLRIDNLKSCSKVITDASGNQSCGTDQNTTYYAGQGLGLSSFVFTVNSSLTGSSLKFTSISGSIIRASNSLNSSGSLTVKGTSTLQGTATAPTVSSSDNSTNIATTAYVTTGIANAVAAVNPAIAVQAATTSASNTSGLTYSNGAGGIGATFTGTNNTAITIDGYTFTAIGQRLLVKNDTQSPSGAFNGIYYVTQVQTAILPPILTRASDYNQPSDINNTGAVPVVNGTVNADTSWLLTSAVNTVGTDPLTYVQFSFNPTTIITGGGQGLTKNGNSLVLNNTLTGSYAKYNAFSGSVVHAEKLLSSSGSLKWITTATGSSVYSSIVRAGTSLASSGTLVWEGAASGASLWVSSFAGAGLTNCDPTTGKLTWNSTVKQFVCGTDGGSSYYAGHGLGLASNVFSLNSSITGSTLKVTGTISGALLVLSNDHNCTLKTSGTGNIICGSDNNTTYTASNGITLNGTAFGLNAALSGSYAKFNAFSGSVIHAEKLLSSSGSLKVLGNMSGATLNVNSLLSCTNISTNASGRLSCNATTYLTSAVTSAGQGLTLLGTSALRVNSTLTGTLANFQTLSGATIYAHGSTGTLSGQILRIGSAPSPSCTGFGVFSPTTAMTTGSGKVRITVPPTMSGYYVGTFFMSVDSNGLGGTGSLQIRDINKGGRKIFSTVPNIKSTQTGSNTGSPYVINTSNSTVGANDSLVFDIPSINTTRAALGLGGSICFYRP